MGACAHVSNTVLTARAVLRPAAPALPDRTAELLRTGNVLVVFPEGEIHHLNERLMPLLDGVAFMALAAQRELAEAGSQARVWIVPAAIRYRFAEDVRPRLEAAMARLEARLFWWKPPPGASLPERILRFGEALLTIKEKEKLGRSGESDGDLATRIGRLIDALLARHEAEHAGRSPSADTVPLRVKALRRKLLELRCADTADQPTRRKAQDAPMTFSLHSSSTAILATI